MKAPGETAEPTRHSLSGAGQAGTRRGSHSVKAWRSLLLVAAFVACVPFTASADDVVVAQINGVDIKQSDLDFAASEVGAQLANFPPEDRRRMLLQFVLENELMAVAAA
jgi:peptidyl-prolyl cis-trans isomerase C